MKRRKEDKRDKNLLNRSIEIIKNEGIREYSRAIKRELSLHPIGDELWYLINYHLHYSHSPTVIKEVQGSKMLLNLSDKGIHKELFLYGYREPECTKIFKEELSEGMEVVDIGANIGYYVLIEAQIVGEAGNIYAIEPEPANFEVLKKNIELNSYDDRVELYNMAIGDKIGRAFLKISGHSNWDRIATLSEMYKERNACIEVKVTTLDEFLRGKDVDFIRMDVEGFESCIVKGMEEILNKNKQLKLFIEIHPWLIRDYGENVESMLDTLSKANFKVKYLIIKGAWSSISHYIKGKALPPERSVKYDLPLKSFLKDTEIKKFLNRRYAYSLFMEKCI